MESSNEIGKENKELKEFQPGVKIYLMRHADKPSDAKKPELLKGIEEDNEMLNPDLQKWHRDRHEAGLAPRLPKESWLDLGKFVIKDNSLSLKGIIESHDFVYNKNLINQAINDFPKGNIKILFYNTEAYRTTETNQVIAEEIKAQLKKLKEEAREVGDIEKIKNLNRISIEEPGIDGISNLNLEEEKDEGTKKSTSDIDNFVNQIQERALDKSENLLVFATTHADKIENYIELKTGEKQNIETTDYFLIEN